MREEIKSTLLIMVLFGLILVTFVRIPAWSQGIVPPTVRFTGTFYPPDIKDVKGGIETLKIIIGKREEKKEWVCNIYEAENLNNLSQTVFRSSRAASLLGSLLKRPLEYCSFQ